MDKMKRFEMQRSLVEWAQTPSKLLELVAHKRRRMHLGAAAAASARAQTTPRPRQPWVGAPLVFLPFAFWTVVLNQFACGPPIVAAGLLDAELVHVTLVPCMLPEQLRVVRAGP